MLHQQFALDVRLKLTGKLNPLSISLVHWLIKYVKESFPRDILDYEYSLFRLVRRARRERKPRKKKMAAPASFLSPGSRTAIFSRAVFFRVSLDGLSERETTRSLEKKSCNVSKLETRNSSSAVRGNSILDFRKLEFRVKTTI